MATSGDVVYDQHYMTVYLYAPGTTAAGTGPWVEIPPQYNVRTFFADPGDNTNTVGADSIDIQTGSFLDDPTSSKPGASVQTLTTTTIQATRIESHTWVRAVKTGTNKTVTVIMIATRNE